MRRLGELLEAELLVPLHLAGIGAEADRRPALGLRSLEEGLEQLLPDALAAAARDDGDRQLRRLLVDEAEARLVGGEHAVPRGAVRVRAFHGDDAGVALASPVADVAVDGPLRVLAHPPEVRVAEHVAEEARVLSVGGPKHRPESRSAGASERALLGLRLADRLRAGGVDVLRIRPLRRPDTELPDVRE